MLQKKLIWFCISTDYFVFISCTDSDMFNCFCGGYSGKAIIDSGLVLDLYYFACFVFICIYNKKGPGKKVNHKTFTTASCYTSVLSLKFE